ncbi:MAG TPA: hypothetical protein V6D08_20865 [Candidatus Obscuribacterales bacterium]
MSYLKRYARKSRGAYMAELPVVLWLLLICVAFPLLILATVTVRISLLGAVAKDAAHAASKAETFESPGESGTTPALTLAKDTAASAASKLTGVTLVGTPETRIVVIDTSDPSKAPDVKSPNTKLQESDPIDTTRYLYQIQVAVTGEIEPLIKFNLPVFGDIPGLTQPIKTTQVGIEYFEHPQGLKK